MMRTTPFLLLVLLACPALAVVDVGDIQSVTLQVPTRHVQWAKPLPDGPLKTLVIAPRYGLRDLAELGQRLDLDWTVVPTGHFKAWGAAQDYIPGVSEADALARLEAALEHSYDLIIIGNFQWDLLPRPQLYEILKQVRDGAGLVYVPFEPTPELLGRLFDPAPDNLLPQWIEEGAAAGAVKILQRDGIPVEFTGVLGSGRMVILRWPSGGGGIHSLTPGNAATWHDYELCQQVLVRSCLWAAGRVPAEPLVPALPDEMPRAATAGLTLGPFTHDWELTIWDDQGQEEAALFGKAGTAAELGAPLKNGAHIVALRLLDGDICVDAAAHHLLVTGSQAIGELEFDKPFVEVGETVTVSVPLEGEITPELRCILSVFDLYGQEIWREERVLAAGEQVLEFAFRPWESRFTRHRVRAGLHEGATVAAERWAELLVPTRGHDDLEIIGWALPGGSYLYDQLAAHARRLGFTAGMFSGNINSGIRPVPYTTSYRYSGLERITTPCYTNPEDMAKEAEKLQEAARKHLPLGLLAYGLGDENTLSVSHIDVCISPTCLASLRDYLQERYGSIEDLNRQWGTNHAAWAEIMPMTLQEARQHGNLAPFIDHRLHQDEVFADLHLFAQHTLNEIDPLTPTGPEGLWNTSALAGFHWARFGRELGLVNVYTDEYLKRELVRSVSPPGSLRGMWYGSYNEDLNHRDRLTRVPWMMLLHDQNSIWWYGVTNYSHLGSCMTAFAADYRVLPHLAQTTVEWDTLHRGAARLIMNMQRRQDGIAVVYSRPSAYAFGLGTEDLLAALEDAGYQYDVLPVEDLESAAIDSDRYRVLLLPGSRALSEGQALAVEAFAAAGGTVIADLLPARYDGHATERDEGRLNRLLGLAEMGLEVNQAEVTATVGDLQVPLQHTGSCTVGAGQALGSLADGTPVVITATAGAGRAVYLNFSLEGYRRLRQEDTLPAHALLLGRLLQEAGLAPTVTVTRPDGTAVPRIEVCRYAAGSIELVGLLREVGSSPDEVQAHIRLPHTGHVHDLRTGRYFGETDSINTSLGAVGVYALLPYRVSAVAVSLQAPAVAAGESLAWEMTVQAGDDRPGMHILHLELLDPSGNTVAPGYNVVAENGRAQWTWPVPWNAAPGQWRLQATDALTGTMGTATVTIRP